MCARLRATWPLVFAVLVGLLSGPHATAQAQDGIAAQRLQDLTDEERVQLLQQLEGSANPELTPLPEVDDRISPRPMGTSPADSLVLLPLPPLETPEGLERFGQSLFTTTPGMFAPPSYGPVPPDYRLGPGDVVVVQIWGDVQQRLEARVGRDGTIVLRDVGQVTAGGLTLAAVESEIVRRLAQVMSGIDPEGGGSTHVDVTLGALRSIQVFVVGEARRPLGYEMSSVSTVFHALYAAGGPSAIGSMRDVQLIRNNQVAAHLDLYSILMRGTREGDVVLRDGDTVFVPVASRSITVLGEVRRPGVYELKPDESLADAIRFAGGRTPAARADVAHIRRVLPPGDRQPGQTDRVDLTASLSIGDAAFPLEDGDELTLLAVSEAEESYVLAGGSLVSPGRYGFADGMRVSDLVAAARGVRRDALAERALLIRMRKDSSRESYAVDLTDLTPGSGGDLSLSPLDSLHVFSSQILTTQRRVMIHGQVAVPGEYEYFEYMSVRDLVLAAGGLLESADEQMAEVSRVDPTANDRHALATVGKLSLDAASGAAERFLLENHDQVFVRSIPGYELQRNVHIEGEVQYPGVYSLLHREERLSEVIERAGGLRESAYPEGFRLNREANGVGNLGLDLVRALKDPGSRHDVILQAGDRIEIPPRPMSVKISGAVGFPTSVIWQRGHSIGDYIDSAGGTTRLADRRNTKVVYPNGLSAKVRRWWRDPHVAPGSTIFVPERDPEEGIDWGSVIVGTTQVLSSLATIYLVIDRAGN